MNEAHVRRQAAVVSDVAHQALRTAMTAAPHPGAGEVALGLPAAARLLGQPAEPNVPALQQSPHRLNDRLGHSRPPYHPLVVHLHLAAGVIATEDARQLVDAMPTDGDLAQRLWRALCRIEAGDPAARDDVDAIVNTPGPSGELHRFDDSRDLLDAWWYRELVSLHAMVNLAVLVGEETWHRRVDEVVAYHLENTQPDHTTAQPWGVAAFARQPASTIFAEQQMHDAQSQWMFHGPGSAIMPALLLADAARTLSLLAEEPVR